MGIGAELQALFRQHVLTIAGFYNAARAKHLVPRLFWITLSIAVSAVCAYNMFDAWEVFEKHRTIVKVTVRIAIAMGIAFVQRSY